MRLAVLYHRFGPYHRARLQALSRGGDLVAMEGSPVDRIYGWDRIAPLDGIRHERLFPDGDLAERAPGSIRSRVGEILDDARPQVVAFPSWGFTASLYALEWCLKRRVPALVMTDSQERDLPRSWWKETLKRAVVRHCAGAFVAGRRSADYVARLGIPPGRIRAGCDVVDNRHFAEGADRARQHAPNLRSTLGLPPRYLLASARFVPRKNLTRLIHAFARFAQEPGSTDWHLVILGDGPRRAELEREIEARGIGGRVRLPGFRQYDELPAYYGLAEAFVHVSTSEQWGLVVNEAMAAGLPVIVSDACGCAPELVDEGANGIICRADDVASIAAALQRIAGEGIDRRAMGRASRERISRFTPESFAAELWLAADDARRRETGGPHPLARLICRLLARGVRRAGLA